MIKACVRARTAPSRAQNRPQPFTGATFVELGGLGSGKEFTRRPGGIEHISLRAVPASWAFRPVDLDDPFTFVHEMARQPSPVAASAFDGPHPGAGSVCSREGEHSAISLPIGGQLDGFELCPSFVNDRCGVGMERAHLLVTHTRGLSRALLEKVLSGARETPWLEWELGVPGLDRSIHRHSPASHGLDECKLRVWMLAQPLADSSRWMLALVLDHSQVMPGRGPASARLQSPRWL